MSTIDDLSEDLRAQAAFLKDREPVYERMLALFAEAIRGEFGKRLGTLWEGRAFNSRYERPLLLLAAIRYDALCEGEDHPLHGPLSEGSTRLDAVTRDAFIAALSPTRTRVERVLRERFVHTNETTRALAWLWPAYLLWSAAERRSIALADLGTSAGLNLVADDLPALWVDDHEAPIPLEPRPPVVLRLGLDLSPLDVGRTDDAMWLRACVWPDDRPRLARLEQAIQAFTSRASRGDAPTLEACSLPEAPRRLSSLPEHLFVLCVQTIVRDFMSAEQRAMYEAGMREFLLKRPVCSALVAELEVDASSLNVPSRSATLAFRFACGGGRVNEMVMARTHPHPRQLFIDAAALKAFADAFSLIGP